VLASRGRTAPPGLAVLAGPVLMQADKAQLLAVSEETADAPLPLAQRRPALSPRSMRNRLPTAIPG